MLFTIDLLKTFAAACVVGGFACQPVLAETLKPFKDDLFAYHTILEEGDGGAFLKIDYQEMRDINRRDEVPESHVKPRYVSLSVRRQQHMEAINIGGRQMDILRVGEIENAGFAVIFVHGGGGDRRLGANDFSFGGNFNRLKNLAIANGGAYLAPSMKGFERSDASELSGLIRVVAMRAPKARIILSCASMGSYLCWAVAHDAVTVEQLGGMIIMCGPVEPDYANTAAFKKRLPLFFSHGSGDKVYPANEQIAFYKSLRAEKYPTRFVLFETGSHGTPLRMTDWRDALNWFLTQ